MYNKTYILSKLNKDKKSQGVRSKMKKIAALTTCLILIISILLPGVSACTMQGQGVSILSSDNDCIEVVTTIKDGDNWVNLYEANPGEKMRFRINVTYHDVDGDAIGYILKHINITYQLPDGFEYLENSTHTESFISPDGKNITWRFTKTLTDGKSLAVEFDVKANETGVFVSNIFVEGTESCYGAYRSKSSFAMIVSGCTDDVKYKDVDDDGNLERAYDLNSDPSDGYEVFVDPDLSSDDVKNIDGDGDGKIDHFIDIDGDDLPDRYWDPDNDVLSEVDPIDVDYDGTEEWVYDSDGDEKPDKYYDPDDGQIHPYVVFEITIHKTGKGEVSKDPDGQLYLEDFDVKLAAEADAGWKFAGYSGDIESHESSVTITIDDNKTINALFVEETDGDGPTVEITKPEENFFYLFNIKLLPLNDKTEIYGPVNIKAKAESDKEIEKVEFYIDDVLKRTDTRAPYHYWWFFKPLGVEEAYTITVVAYDEDGDSSDSIDVVRARFIPSPPDDEENKNLLLRLIVVIGGGLLLKSIFNGDDGGADDGGDEVPDDGGGDGLKERPSTDAGGPYTGIVGKAVNLDAESSGSGDLTYSWEFGDGSTGSGKNPSHTYSKPGRHNVKLTVTNSDGLSSTDTTYVEVSEPEAEDDGDLFWYIVSSLGAVLTASLGLLFFRRRLYV